MLVGLTCAYVGLLVGYCIVPLAYPGFLHIVFGVLSGIGFAACIVICYGFLLCIGAAVFALLNRTDVHRESWTMLKSRGSSICTYCGYDVRTCSQAVCPECGHKITSSGASVSTRVHDRPRFVMYRENPLPGLYVGAFFMIPLIIFGGDSRGLVLLFSIVLISIVLVHAIRLLTPRAPDD